MIALFFIPESPKYLLSKKKVPEAKAVLVKITKVNNKGLAQSEITSFVSRMRFEGEGQLDDNIDNN